MEGLNTDNVFFGFRKLKQDNDYQIFIFYEQVRLENWVNKKLEKRRALSIDSVLEMLGDDGRLTKKVIFRGITDVRKRMDIIYKWDKDPKIVFSVCENRIGYIDVSGNYVTHGNEYAAHLKSKNCQ